MGYWLEARGGTYSRLRKVECGYRVIYVVVPSFLRFGVRGRSYSNFPASAVVSELAAVRRCSNAGWMRIPSGLTNFTKLPRRCKPTIRPYQELGSGFKMVSQLMKSSK